jgi:hypothetical protein
MVLPKSNMSSLFAFLIGLVLLTSARSFVPDSSLWRSGLPLHSAPASSEKSKVSGMTRTVMGPPVETKPDYERMHGPLGKIMDKVFMTVFRTQMANKIGMDSQLPKVSKSLLCMDEWTCVDCVAYSFLMRRMTMLALWNWHLP